MAEWITQTKCAQVIGISRQAIKRLWIDKGRFKTNAKGRILYPHCAEVYHAHKAMIAAVQEDLAESNLPGGHDGPAPPLGPASKMANAKLAKATLQARLLDVRLKREQEILVDAEGVRREGLHVGLLIRATLLAMPDRVAPICVGKTAPEIADIIKDGVNDALEALRESDWTTPDD